MTDVQALKELSLAIFHLSQTSHCLTKTTDRRKALNALEQLYSLRALLEKRTSTVQSTYFQREKTLQDSFVQQMNSRAQEV